MSAFVVFALKGRFNRPGTIHLKSDDPGDVLTVDRDTYRIGKAEDPGIAKAVFDRRSIAGITRIDAMEPNEGNLRVYLPEGLGLVRFMTAIESTAPEEPRPVTVAPADATVKRVKTRTVVFNGYASHVPDIEETVAQINSPQSPGTAPQKTAKALYSPEISDGILKLREASGNLVAAFCLDTIGGLIDDSIFNQDSLGVDVIKN